MERAADPPPSIQTTAISNRQNNKREHMHLMSHTPLAPLCCPSALGEGTATGRLGIGLSEVCPTLRVTSW